MEHRSWTEEDLKIAILSASIPETCVQINRTRAAVGLLRSRYGMFYRTGFIDRTVSPYIHEIFKKFKEEGLEISSIRAGKKTTGLPTEVQLLPNFTELVATSAQPVVSPRRDPYTELDILLDKFKVSLVEIISQIGEQAYAERLRVELEMIQKQRVMPGANAYSKKSAGELLRQRIGFKKGQI